MLRLTNETRIGVTREQAEEHLGNLVEVKTYAGRPQRGLVTQVDDEFIVIEPIGPLLLAEVIRITVLKTRDQLEPEG